MDDINALNSALAGKWFTNGDHAPRLLPTQLLTVVGSDGSSDTTVMIRRPGSVGYRLLSIDITDNAFFDTAADAQVEADKFNAESGNVEDEPEQAAA